MDQVGIECAVHGLGQSFVGTAADAAGGRFRAELDDSVLTDHGGIVRAVIGLMYPACQVPAIIPRGHIERLQG